MSNLLDAANGISDNRMTTEDYARRIISNPKDKLYCLGVDNVDVEITMMNGFKYTGRILHGRDSEGWIVFESRTGIDYINAGQVQGVHLITVNGGVNTQFR